MGDELSEGSCENVLVGVYTETHKATEKRAILLGGRGGMKEALAQHVGFIRSVRSDGSTSAHLKMLLGELSCNHNRTRWTTQAWCSSENQSLPPSRLRVIATTTTTTIAIKRIIITIIILIIII